MFHETPLWDEQVAAGYTRPYRWHMDAPVYENLPGVATALHSVEVPNLPDQRIMFPNGQEMGGGFESQWKRMWMDLALLAGVGGRGLTRGKN